MRLIDADALAKFIDYGHLNDPNVKNYSENDIREMIDMMPTVDAVPVEWIEEQIRESYDASKEYEGCYDYAWYLSELVKRWREKKGTVD